MVITMIIIAIGAFFTASLFNKKKDKMSIPFAISMMIGIISLFLIAAVGMLQLTKSIPFYEYKVHLYYLGGSEKDVVIESTQDPYIFSCRGSYSLFWNKGSKTYEEQGVVRREILSKKKIKDLTRKDRK